MTSQHDYDRMVKVWVAENRPGTIIVGGRQFTVATPDGDEKPVFTEVSMESAYGSLSTSGVSAIKKTRPVIKSDNAADLQ